MVIIVSLSPCLQSIILTVITVSLVEVAMFTVILTVIIVSLVGVPMFTVNHSKGHYSVIGGGPYVFITTNLLNLCPLFSATRTRKNQQTCVS